MLDFIHLSATGVAEIGKFTNMKGCLHTFVNIVHYQGGNKTATSMLPCEKDRNRAVKNMSGSHPPLEEKRDEEMEERKTLILQEI